MSTICITCNFDGPLRQMTFTTISFIHIILFYNLDDYFTTFSSITLLILSLDHVCHLYYYSTFSIQFTHAIMK